MSEQEVDLNLLSDPDNPPLSATELRRMRPVPNPKEIRRLNPTKEPFAARFGLPFAPCATGNRVPANRTAPPAHCCA